MIEKEGIIALFRSYPITVLMNIPFSCCFMVVNENMKTYIKPWNRRYENLWYFFCAGIAGGVAGCLTNPFDVIKTKLQTQGIHPSCKRLDQMWDVETGQGMNEQRHKCGGGRGGGGG